MLQQIVHSITKGLMRTVEAATTAYSPKHAAPPPFSRSVPTWQWLRIIVVLGCCFAVLCGAAVVAVVLAGRHDACDPGRCVATDGPAPLSALPVMIDSGAKFKFSGPVGITVADGRLWVANSAGQSVTEFGWRPHKFVMDRTAPRYGFSGSAAIASGWNHVWIANTRADSVTEVSASTGNLLRRLADNGLGAPNALALQGLHLWVGYRASSTIAEYDTATGNLILKYRNTELAHLTAIAVSNGDLWIADQSMVARLVAATGQMLGPVNGLRDPVTELLVGTTLWVADRAANSITEISTMSGAKMRVLKGEAYGFSGPDAMTLADGYVWVANGRGNTLTEIAASDGKPVGVLVGAQYGFHDPAGMAAYRGNLWVTNLGSSTVTEILAPATNSGSFTGRLVAGGSAARATLRRPAART
jgi:DNA-binding beta-propeller fold protein YncE